MIALLLALLASPAAADLTAPKRTAGVSGPATVESPEEADAADKAQTAAAFAPLEPLIGKYSGKINCGNEPSTLTLEFDKFLPTARGFVNYTVETPGRGGFASGFVLVDGGVPGEWDSWDGSHNYDGLRFRLRGRELTARGAASGGPQARAVFDASWRSVSVSLNDGKGRRCAGTLPRTRKGPRR